MNVEIGISWDWCRAVSFLGIHKSKFLCCAVWVDDLGSRQSVNYFYVPASYIFCTFQISVDFYFVPVGGRGGGRGGLEKGRGLERGRQNVYCMGTLSVLTVPIQLVIHTVSVLTVPAIFWFKVRRIVHCNTGLLTLVVAGQLAILACLNPCHIKPYWSWLRSCHLRAQKSLDFQGPPP